MTGDRFTFNQMASGIFVPILAIIVILVAWFGLRPKFSSVRDGQTALELKERAVADKRVEYEQIQSLIADYDEKKNDLDGVDKTIPDAPRIPELLSDLDFLASQSGVSIDAIQLTPVETLETARSGRAVEEFQRVSQLLATTDGLGIMEISLNLSGDYVSLKTFLTNLEQHIRLLDVQELAVGESDTESGAQNFGMMVHTYYQQVN